MRSSEGSLWKLSYPELARLCQKIARSPFTQLDSALREEAGRFYGGWTDALSIHKHDERAAERQAGMALALRKRTIELAVRYHQTSE